MGFFSHFNPIKAITRVVAPVIQNPVKAVVSAAKQVVASPIRSATALATGGLSEVARVTPIIGKPFQQLQTLQQTGYDVAADVYTGGLYGQTKNLGSQLLGGTGANPMALNIGGLISGVSNILGGNQNPYFQQASNIGQIASGFFPQQSNPTSAQPAALRLPSPSAVGPVLRSVPTIGRGFFQKYPNLATAMQGLRNMGRKVTRGQLYSMLRRFGPEILISGGILSAAAISELMVAGAGRRRMNGCNPKALNRAARRIKMFHKLCQHTDLLKTHKRRKCA